MQQPKPLAVIYQDQDYIAINKPSGLLVHRSPIARGEKRFALQMLRNQIGCHVYPVHRLDRPTSGILLFALSSEAAKHMIERFKSGEVRKTYMAVARGHTPDEGTIDHALKPIPENNSPAPQDPELRVSSVTQYRTLKKMELQYAVDRYPTSRYSLLILHPLTGRRHQIRRHMKHISHPIIGDTRYGQAVHNHFFRDHFGAKRLLLAATRLQFNHPVTGHDIDIRAELDPLFQTVIDRFYAE
ncbi:MAG: hypothetical protein D3926_11790 [Desulfobacteraceae bacterium]|nr:MAG: hypothetical protein D3926_11790 [Desulfobacteraceae bacterium]